MLTLATDLKINKVQYIFSSAKDGNNQLKETKLTDNRSIQTNESHPLFDILQNILGLLAYLTGLHLNKLQGWLLHKYTSFVTLK